MRLRDQYEGRDDPFEGDRTIVWRSLPENALVTSATLTVEPRLPPGGNAYIETLSFAGNAHGATIRPVVDGTAEIDFHARRTPVAFAGLTPQGTGVLAVDIGGGVYLSVSQNGTIPNTTGAQYDLSQSTLPGIGALRIRLQNFANAKLNNPAALASATVKIASMPSNVTLRFGKRLPFWSKTGDLAVATTTADITDAVKLAIADAPLENGFYAIPLVLHSDTLGRVAVTLDVEYFGVAPLMPAGLREVVLAYDHATTAKQDTHVLQATLPAGAAVVPQLTSLQLRGGFEATRVAYGPTGTAQTSEPIHCSASETLAQPIVPARDTNVAAIDLLVAADGPAARLALDLRADFDGKPGQNSLLAKPVPFDIAGDATHQLSWTSVPVAPEALLRKIDTKSAQRRYWVVVQALDGAAWLGVDANQDSDRLIQRSTNAGFSWRGAGLSCPLLLRLRTVPDRFEMPIEFVAGTQRASLDKYDALGKIDAVIDRPEIATAVQAALTKALPAPCAQGELLQNADFALWRADGTGLGAAAAIQLDALASGQSAMVVVDAFFDTATSMAGPAGISAPHDLTFSPDGATLYAAANGKILAVDIATLATKSVDDEFNALTLAADQRDTLYALSMSRLAAYDPATDEPAGAPFSLSGARTMALARDGKSAYVAVSDTNGMAIVALDLVTGTPRWRIAGAASALALGPDEATVFAIDEQTRQVAAYDTMSGAPRWTAILPDNLAPRAVTAAANDGGAYVVGTGFATSNSSITTFPVFALVAFDAQGRVSQSVTLPSFTGNSFTLRAKPQGDRLYVADAPIVLDPAGRHLVAIAPIGKIVAVPIGNRQPLAWTLTAGGVAPRPSSDMPARIEASVQSGALSQVVAVTPGCFHDFAVDAMVGAPSSPAGFSTGLSAGAESVAEAVAELFWLDAAGALLGSIPLTLPVSTRFVQQRQRTMPPPAGAQAEVRVRVTDGTCVLRSVSLRATDTLLDDEAWQMESAAHAIIATSSDNGATYQNLGAAEAALTQSVPLSPSTPYVLDFRGGTIANPAGTPYFELNYRDAAGASLGSERIVLDSVAFSRRPAALSVPDKATAALIRIVLPPGARINAESVQLLPRPTTPIPVTFIAQSPGELHVSHAQVVYDWKPGPRPSPPAGGLSPPTPPDATPGDPSCCPPCGDEKPAAAASAVLSAAPAPVQPSAQLAAVAFDAPLTSIVGIAAARESRLVAAGILTLRDLANATPQRVVAALAGEVAPTPELAAILIGRAKAALGMPNGNAHE